MLVPRARDEDWADNPKVPRTEIERSLGIMEGTVPIPEYFAPENIERIIGGPATAPAA